MTIATKERPMIFSPESVAAILAGSKTQTRRIVGPQPNPRAIDIRVCEWIDGRFGVSWREGDGSNADGPVWGALTCFEVCPYGKPGDHLWVKEAWQQGLANKSNPCIRYKADNSAKLILYDNNGEGDPVELGDQCEPWTELAKWRNAMYMPRWASRLTLEITEIRVERVQDISHSDTIAEGAWDVNWAIDQTKNMPLPNWLAEWRELWNRINGHGSWEANPLVWCLSFKPVETNR